MPSLREFGKLIFRVEKGGKDGINLIGLVKDNAYRGKLCEALESLDLAHQNKLIGDEKETIGYNTSLELVWMRCVAEILGM